MNDVSQRAQDVIALELALRRGELALSSSFVDDLRIGALEMTSLAMALESQFLIVFEPGAEQQWSNVGDAVHAVEQALQVRPPLLIPAAIALQT